MNAFTLEGKIAIITGAAMGLGYAEAKKFLELGAKVAVCDVNPEALNKALEEAGVLLLLKPHPVQDMGAIAAGSYSSFKLIYDRDLQKAQVQLYEMLADADALLTD